MNYATFKIIETPKGEWVLVLHNHSRKLISLLYRSGNRAEVVKKLNEEVVRRKYFIHALGNMFSFGIEKKTGFEDE